jgi:hypothetical protein
MIHERLNIQAPQFTISAYVGQLERGEVTVNRRYQRSSRVWPQAARSFLIETILLNYPIPKLSLHQLTDVTTLRATMQVVDGQQRTFAIRDFMRDGFRLSRRLELEGARGKLFSQLSDQLKAQFLHYPLSFDLFVGASDDQVREVFRRMNSFTVPLNPEEQRHATFQGPFKWFIYELSGDYSESFLNAGVLGDRSIIRMADAKLLTEISHAYFNGVHTTSKNNLAALYRSRDEKFPEEAELGRRLRTALDFVLGLEEFHNTALMTKQHVFYALVLAAMHVQETIPTLADDVPLTAGMASRTALTDNLTLLEAALDEDEARGPYADFLASSSERTNVAAQRLQRIRWLAAALTDTLP